MNLKKVLVAAAAIAIASMLHTAPAHAAIPGCASYSALAPRREALPGPDVVKANFAMGNWCDQAFVVDLTIMADVECLYFCAFQPIQKNTYPVAPQSENGFEISAGCLQDEHRYYMDWVVSDSNGVVLGFGNTDVSLLNCENRPPPPDVDAYCNKVPEPCKLIRP